MLEQESKLRENLSVGIVGCGWLGSALATELLQKGCSVLATSSKLENVDKLNGQGICSQQLVLPTEQDKLIDHDIFAQQCLVLAIPPQFKQGRRDYGDKITQLVSAAQRRGIVQHIILLSSTAIYQGLSGIVDEESQLNLSSEKAQMLHQAEQSVLAFHHQANVLRLSGLVGPNRHPGKFLLANKVLKNAVGKINLIHQHDAVGLIVSLLFEGPHQGIFNGVSENHVSKQVYYQHAAKALSLPVPHFAGIDSKEAIRVVNGDKAKTVLGYSFIYPDLLAWL